MFKKGDNNTKKKIAGYNGDYKISSFGDVFSYKKSKVKKLKATVGENGYKKVTLSRGGRKKTHMVHRLVAEHFISNPNNFDTVDHIDENKLNNSAQNLRWLKGVDNSHRNKKDKLPCGVYRHGPSFRGCKKIKGKAFFSPSMRTVEEAVNWRLKMQEGQQ